jgi:hypothetical protein
MTAKLCTLAVAVVVITRTRVTLLPGWQVPLTAALITAEAMACAALVAWLITQERRRTRRSGDACTCPIHPEAARCTP